MIASPLKFFKLILLNLGVNKIVKVGFQVNEIDIQEFRFLCMSVCIHDAKKAGKLCSSNFSLALFFFFLMMCRFRLLIKAYF